MTSGTKERASASSKRSRDANDAEKLASLVSQTQSTEAQLRALWPRLRRLRGAEARTD